MSKDRLLYLTGASFKHPTAQLVHVLKMCSGLSSFYEVDLFVFDKNDATNIADYSLQNSPNILSFGRKKISVSLQLCFVLLVSIVKNRYCAVVTRNVVSAFACHLLKIKYIYETHDAYRGYLKKIFESSVLKSNSLIEFVVISNRLALDYKALYNCNPQVCSDAADVYDHLIPIRTRVKKVFYIGSLYSGRGKEIIDQLAERNQDLEFHIFGGSSVYVDSNVIYHGYKSQKEIRLAVRQADVLLMPYQTKLQTANGGIDTVRWMSPMKMFEYMSFGLPIISSDLPVLREVLNDTNCVLATPSDIDDWHMKLSTLKNDESLRTMISENARQDFISNFTWSKRAEVFSEFIDNQAR
jgi:glycosyltransferase involved in cell wall biosynthesis